MTIVSSFYFFQFLFHHLFNSLPYHSGQLHFVVVLLHDFFHLFSWSFQAHLNLFSSLTHFSSKKGWINLDAHFIEHLDFLVYFWVLVEKIVKNPFLGMESLEVYSNMTLFSQLFLPSALLSYWEHLPIH